MPSGRAHHWMCPAGGFFPCSCAPLGQSAEPRWQPTKPSDRSATTGPIRIMRDTVVLCLRRGKRRMTPSLSKRDRLIILVAAVAGHLGLGLALYGAPMFTKYPDIVQGLRAGHSASLPSDASPMYLAL